MAISGKYHMVIKMDRESMMVDLFLMFQECSQFQAGDIIRSKNQTANLRVTGVFGSACRHEVPLLFMDLRHGER